jgi:hypothetical protein
MGHVLDDGLARLEELVLGRQELVVDAVAVALLAPPLVRPDLPAVRQALVSCNSNNNRMRKKITFCYVFSRIFF